MAKGLVTSGRIDRQKWQRQFTKGKQAAPLHKICEIQRNACTPILSSLVIGLNLLETVTGYIIFCWFPY